MAEAQPQPGAAAPQPQTIAPIKTIGTAEGFSLMPRTFEELNRFVHMVASSDLVPKAYKGQPANVMVAIHMGMDLGLKPMQALQSIAVVNGFPSLWGDGALAIVMASGQLEEIEELSPEETIRENTGRCIVKRKGMRSITRTFTKMQAQQAGLWDKRGRDGQPTPWITYPGRMLQMRARALALRDLFPDILRGFHIGEEVQDIPVTPSKVEDVTEAIPTAEELDPKSKSQMEAEKVTYEIKNAAGETVGRQMHPNGSGATTTKPDQKPEKATEGPKGSILEGEEPDFDDSGKDQDLALDLAGTKEDRDVLLDAMEIKKIKAPRVLDEMKTRFNKGSLNNLTKREILGMTKWVNSLAS